MPHIAATVITDQKSLLYNKDVISNLFSILSVNCNDLTPVVIIQSQAQIIKAIVKLIETEWKATGVQSEYLKFLSDEGKLLDLFIFLQRNAGKP